MNVLPDYGLKTEILTYSASIDSITRPDPSFNPIMYSIQNLFKRFIRCIFIRINHCFFVVEIK